MKVSHRNAHIFQPALSQAAALQAQSCGAFTASGSTHEVRCGSLACSACIWYLIHLIVRRCSEQLNEHCASSSSRCCDYPASQGRTSCHIMPDVLKQAKQAKHPWTIFWASLSPSDRAHICGSSVACVLLGFKQTHRRHHGEAVRVGSGTLESFLK